MIREHKLQVPRTARYCTIGEAGPNTKYFWLACHGYGQLAKNFIKKFDVLASEDTFILAPEGLSRFYWGGLSGEPVASWMTKEARLEEIADYSNYLSMIYEEYTAKLPQEVKVILFGFSQGCATQMRWMTRRQPDFHSLVLWAGTIPEDIDYTPHLPYFEDKKIHFVRGAEDPFITPERLEAYYQEVAQTGLKWEEHTFEGKHTVDREALQKLATQL